MHMIFFTTHNTYPRLSGGYTLVELIVSMALFGVVILMASSAFLGVMSSNRKALAMRTALDNLNFAIESMTRDMKTGFTYHCGAGGGIGTPQDCTSTPSSYIAFEGQSGNPNSDADQIVYRLQDGRIERSSNAGGNFFPITAPPPELTITRLAFRVYGSDGLSDTNDARQARIVIVVTGSASSGNTATTINMQTSISQRLPDT